MFTPVKQKNYAFGQIQIGQIYLKGHGMRRISDFSIFCIILSCIGPLHNCESPFDFAIEFAEIFIFDNRLPAINDTGNRQNILT
jgi:hypothetical protein